MKSFDPPNHHLTPVYKTVTLAQKSALEASADSLEEEI